MRGSDKIGDTGLLAHFHLETNPFSHNQDRFRFFEIFNMNPTQPFTFEQTMVYIQFLLNEAGPGNQIAIKEAAHEALYRLSNGRVDQINTLMDQALRKAFTDGTQEIGQRHVEEMADETPIAEEAIFNAPLAEVPDSEGLKVENGAQTSTPKKTVPIMVAAMVLLGLAAAVWLSVDRKQRPDLVKKTVPTKPVTQETPKQAPKPSKPTVAPVPAPAPPTAPAVPEKNVDNQALQPEESVANFLAAYNLQAYERQFSDALYHESFEDLTQKIYNETGLMLIHFTLLHERFKQKYHILDKLMLNPVHTRYFLFWKPAPVITDWEYGTRGKPIRQVQTMLKKVGIYGGEIDGVVDVELMRAILRFQGQNFLEKTGHPDPTTLFFLTALSQ